MSVKSVLHKLADDLNMRHLHEEIEAPDEEVKAPETEEPTDAKES